MRETIITLLKNIGCSYCQEYEFQDNKDNLKNWKLYLKEYEMYSAMILYNDIIDKDISYLININDIVCLLNDKDEIILKLEFISFNKNDNNSILVPTDEYNNFYTEIEEMDKKYDTFKKANYINIYNIKIIKKK